MFVHLHTDVVSLSRDVSLNQSRQSFCLETHPTRRFQ